MAEQDMQRIGMTEDEGDTGKVLRENGISRDQIYEVLKSIRGGQRITDQNPEDKYQALERYGLVSREEVDDVLVLPERFGYPVYDRDFEKVKSKAEEFFSAFTNLHRVGRNAEFRHIEADEDLESAIATVRAVYGRVSVRTGP